MITKRLQLFFVSMGLTVLFTALVAGIVAPVGRVGAVLSRADGVEKEGEPAWDQAVCVSSEEELQEALDGAVYGTVISITGDIALSRPLTLNKENVAIRLESGEDRATIAAPRSRHFTCSGANIDLLFRDVVLDGCGTGGGVSTTAQGLSLSGVTVENCYSPGSGGGVEAVSGALQIGEDTCIQNNQAAAHGGGISAGPGVSLQLDGGTVSGNTAAAYGGGIFCDVSGSLGMNGGTIRDNRAIMGGGVYSGLSGKLRLDSGEIRGNQATGASADSGLGGGVYLVTADIIISGAVISENQALSGGGIYATGDGSSVVVHGGGIRGNQAVGSNACGGGVYLDTSYSTSNTITVNNGEIGGNQAVRGGGVFAGGTAPGAGSSSPGGGVAAKVTINGGQVVDNTGGYGGGVYAGEGCGVHLGGGVMGGNSAVEGGAIWASPLELVVVESEGAFYGNSADTVVHTPAEEHVELHGKNIKTTAFTQPFNYAYNNCDIVYQGGTSTPRYSITFDYGEAAVPQGAPSGLEVAHGEPVGPLPRPELPGYTFQGWFTQSGEQVTEKTPVTGNLALGVRFAPNTYTITFDYGGVTPPQGSPGSKTVTFGQPVGELPLPVGTPKDVFSGWFSAAGVHIFPATPYRDTRDITLTARWSPLEGLRQQITFDYNGASEGTGEDSRTVEYGEQLGELPQPEREQYEFSGWTNAGGEVQYTPQTVVEEDLDLHAKWERLPWTITFDYRGGEGESLTPTKEVPHNTPVGDLPQPSREGYRFAGWYTVEEQPVTPETPVTGNLLLYAKWEGEEYSLHFDYQGASNGELPEQKPVVYGQMMGLLPYPMKEGQQFIGWFSQPEASGEYAGGITSGKPYSHTGDSVLYAGWTGEQYPIHFAYEGATAGDETAEKQVTYGDQVGVLPFPTREGYRFAGWFTGPGGTGRQVFAGTSFLQPGELTLYAHWEAVAALVQPDETGQGPSRDRGYRGTDMLQAQAEQHGPEVQPDWENPSTGRPPEEFSWPLLLWFIGLAGFALALWNRQM